MISLMRRLPSEHADYGRNLVWTGDLAKLRARLGLAPTAVAAMLHMSPVTYKRCETQPSSAGSMWTSTAERLGRFAYLAERTLADLESEGIRLDEMVPLHIVATTHGLPQEVLLSWYRLGAIQAEDLGILGLWIHKEDLHLVREAT